MFQGVYSAATALDAAAHSHEVISRNLAHINVPGFRRRQIAIEQFDTQQADSSLIGANVYTQKVDFTPGRMEVTDRNLDVAINGDVDGRHALLRLPKRDAVRLTPRGPVGRHPLREVQRHRLRRPPKL